MKNKYIILLITVVTFGVLGLLCLPSSRWTLHGLIFSETFYKGKPSSYWRVIVKQRIEYEKLHPTCIIAILKVAQPPPPPPSWRDKLCEFTSGFFADPRLSPPNGNDPEALPILLELVDDPDPEVREYIALTLCQARPAGGAAVLQLEGRKGDIVDYPCRRSRLK